MKNFLMNNLNCNILFFSVKNLRSNVPTFPSEANQFNRKKRQRRVNEKWCLDAVSILPNSRLLTFVYCFWGGCSVGIYRGLHSGCVASESKYVVRIFFSADGMYEGRRVNGCCVSGRIFGFSYFGEDKFFRGQKTLRKIHIQIRI